MISSENKLEHKILNDGTEEWRLPNSSLHQDNDLPAIIHPDGTEIYWKKGKLFRKYGPTIKHPDVYELWNTNENYFWHREDGAFMIETTGKRKYYINGKIVNYDKFRKRQIRTHNI